MQHNFKYLIERLVLFCSVLLNITMFFSPISTASAELSVGENIVNNEIMIVEGNTQNDMSVSEVLEIQAICYMDRCNILEANDVYEDYIYPLAKIIYAEGGNMDDTFQQYVGYTVMNRIDSVYYPDTMEEVFFSGAYAESSKERFNAEMYTEQALKNAEIVINQYLYGEFPVSKAMVFQAQFEQGCNIIQMENTYFGCDPRILDDLEKENVTN